MKRATLHSTLRIVAIMLGITIASHASAKYFHDPAVSSDLRIVKVVYTPASDLSVFGTFNNSGSGFLGILRIPSSPITTLTLCDGGDHGRDGGGDDSTGGGDTTGGLGGDTTHHCGGFGGDTTHHCGGLGGDTTFFGGDTTHCGGFGGDTTGGGDHNGLGDDNDTVDCGHHHAGNDTTNVNDTSTHTLFGGGRQSIVVKSHGQQATVTFTFKNNLTSSVTISNTALASGRNFTIVSGAPTRYKPAKLAAGASISLTIAFNAADNSVHTDQLVIQSNSAQTLNSITIQGQQVAAASVANSLPAGVTITAAPNPMTTSLKVAIAGVNSASVIIYDMTGKQILSSPVTSTEWVWNGNASDGTMLLSGSYMVRLSGVSADGSPFSSTQKIILAR